MQLKESFASRLKYLREEGGLSQNELAKTTGINQATISKWEQEKSDPPLALALKIAKHFNVSLDYLSGWKDS